VLRDARPVAFLATADAARARSFYEGRLELRLLADEEFALVFELGATTLRIAKVAELTPQPFTVFGWVAEDVDASVRALGTRGVIFERFGGLEQDELAIWTAPSGARVAWFKDPDGNLLSLSNQNLSPLWGGRRGGSAQ
jgi:catechol 2,3-dioxygenase-like lactoylglutathione lyase family enzyme